MLSESTEAFAREVKMPIYAREVVRHAWLVDPSAKEVGLYTLDAKGCWVSP